MIALVPQFVLFVTLILSAVDSKPATFLSFEPVVDVLVTNWISTNSKLNGPILLRGSNPHSPLCLSCASLGKYISAFFIKSAIMESQIIQEFRPRLDARHEQVVSGPRPGEET